MATMADKLMESWEKHGSLIIAVDFDDTIFNYRNSPDLDFTLVHQKLREARALGCRIVIYTARNESEFQEVIEFCKAIDLEIEGININLADPSSGLGSSGKIYYNLLLDDKAGLSQAYLILKEIVRRIGIIINGN